MPHAELCRTRGGHRARRGWSARWVRHNPAGL